MLEPTDFPYTMSIVTVSITVFSNQIELVDYKGLWSEGSSAKLHNDSPMKAAK